ncbi:MAG: hypothetical protein WD512_13905, partial [Candidatus Paceibacterota bacterium]
MNGQELLGGSKIYSDRIRTQSAEGVWNKLVRNGEAKKLPDGGYELAPTSQLKFSRQFDQKEKSGNVKEAIERNNGEPLNLTPDGKPSILYQSYKDLGYTDQETEELVAQVYSDNFIKWFGDWQVPWMDTVEKSALENKDLDNLIGRIPFLNPFNQFVSENRDERMSPEMSEDIQLQYVSDKINLNRFNGEDVESLAMYTSSNLNFYFNKRNGDNILRVSLKNNIQYAYTDKKTELEERVIALASSQLTDQMSYYKEINLGKSTNLSKEQVDMLSNDLNGVFFKLEDYFEKQGLDTKIFNTTENGQKNKGRTSNVSQVVDANGQPLLLNHGTKEDFTVFKNRAFGYRGFYFTDKVRVAKTYGERLMGVFVSSKDLVEHDMKGGDYADNDTFVDEEIENAEFDEKGIVFKNFIDPLDPSDSKRTPSSDVYVVFNPNQIKSATDNTGEFSSSNNDIRFSIIGEQGAQNVAKEKQSLDQAKQMLTDGINTSEIEQTTGWLYINNQWKKLSKELIESFKIKPTFYDKINKAQTLGDVLADASIFDYYPNLREVQVYYYDKKLSIPGYENTKFSDTISKGFFDETLGKAGVVFINSNNPRPGSTLAHEVTHLLQKVEGFPVGGNIMTLPNEVKKIVGSSATTSNQLLSDINNFDKTKLNEEDNRVVEAVKDSISYYLRTGDTTYMQDDYRLLQGEIDARIVEELYEKVQRGERIQGTITDYQIAELSRFVGKPFNIFDGGINQSLTPQDTQQITQEIIKQIEKSGITVNQMTNQEINDFLESIDQSEVKNIVNGFIYKGEVYLNIDKLRPQLPIHEQNHIYMEWLKKNKPELYQAGLDKVKVELGKTESEIQPIIDYVNQTQPNLTGEALLNEILAEASGRAGWEIIQKEGTKKGGILEFIKGIWDSIKDMLGLSNYTYEEVMNMTLQDYADAIAIDSLK